MGREIVDDQLKLFKEKQSEIESEISMLEQLEIGVSEELSSEDFLENRDELEIHLGVIENVLSTLTSFLRELKDKKKEFEYESEVTLSKLRNKKHKFKKEKIQRESYEKALNPNIKSKRILWKNKDNHLDLLEGYFRDQKLFEIKRGLSLYSLKISNKKLLEYDKAHHSVDLIKLQKKAETIFSSSFDAF